MEDLHIRLLGGMEIRVGGTLLPPFPTQKSASLFAFLALNRNRRFHRDVLCGLFWRNQPDSDARKSLRTALWRIRAVVEPGEAQRGRYLRVDHPFVSVPDDRRIWVDAGQFSGCLASPMRKRPSEITDGDAGQMIHAVSLYQGDLLEGNYDDWCVVDRERLRLRFLAALEWLLSYYRSQGRWIEAIEWGRRILRHDPLREHVHRAIMLCHLAMGDRPSAIRQYEELVALLHREFQIEPMDETRRLHRALRTDGVPSLTRGTSRSTETPAAEEALVFRMEEVVAALYDLAGRLERARTTFPP